MDHDVTDNRLMPEVNNDDLSKAVKTVLRAAELVLKANNNTSSDGEDSMYGKGGTSSMHLYVVVRQNVYITEHVCIVSLETLLMT